MARAIEFNGVDIAVIAVYMMAVLALGFIAGRRERGVTDYFLAGRALPWWLIGFSLYASNMSGASFVGLMGASYAHGMTIFNYEWTAAFVLVVFALVMLPVFLRARLFTVPEYLELRFDARTRRAYSAFTLLAIVLIDVSGAIYAGAIVVSLIVPGIALWQAGAVLALTAGAYTVFGGLRAVVVTDALQAVLMIAGAALIFVIGLDAVGGWDALMAALPADKSALLRPAGDPVLPWPGIGGVILLGFYYWTLNQYFVQRALAAETLDEGRKGALFGGLLKLPNLVLMIVPGLIATRLFPNLPTPDYVFPRLAFELLPVGLRGLVLTALIAAIMSSLDSALNAAASLLTMDFVTRRWPELSDRALLAIGRVFTALLMVLAAAYAPVIRDFGSLFTYFQSTLGYLVPPVVAVYLAGLFFPRASARAAFVTLTGGLGVGASLFVAKEVTGLWAASGLPEVSFLYMTLALFGACLLSLALLSRGAGETAPRELMAMATDLTGPPLRGLGAVVGDHRVQAAALGALTAFSLAFAW